jgi:outer membrane receptor protein involved in Fe transport
MRHLTPFGEGAARKKAHRFVAACAALLILAAAACAPARAQTFKATVLGQVTDQNGAAIPGATVTVTEQGTGRTQTAATVGDGSYTIPQLPPGRYELKVEAAGFKPVVQTDLVLETDKTQRVNVALEAGTVSEAITVVAETPVLNTDTSDKGEVITPRQVQELPLNGRDFTDLALLTPGVYRRPAEDDQGEGLAVNGTRTDATNFILDGVVNRSDRNGSVGVNTSVDSIREFKVETSTFSAEYGRTAGGQVNVVSKSGTNDVHGTLFEYLRNDIFDANNALAAPDEPKHLRRNQFGGTVGGPLPLPRFGEGGRLFTRGRDRSFFFASYEGTIERRSQTAVTNAPDAAWLRGDFRGVRGPGPNGRLGDSDDTGRVLCVTRTGTKVECPVQNVIPFAPVAGFPNVLPANPISLQILPLIPAANVPGSLTGYAASGLSRSDRDQFLAKIDHRFTQNNNFYARYARQQRTGFDPFPSARNFYPNFGRDQQNAYNTLALSDTQVFSARLVNEARFGYYWQHNANLGQHRDVDWIGRLGIPGLTTGQNAAFQGFPAIRIDTFSEFGDRPNDPFIYDIRNAQFFDTANVVRGDHNLKVGADIIRSNYVENDVRNVRGDFRFRGRNTNPAGTTGGPAYYNFADFLYGLPDSTQRQIGSEPSDLTGWQYAFFVQDDWRLHPRLTLNLGLRYELQTPLVEATNRLSNFIPELGTIVLAGDKRFPKTLLDTDKNNWGPRVGFALRPFGGDKTVLRGGAGIYYSLETFNPIRQQLAVAFPFVNRLSYSRSSSNILLLGLPRPDVSTSTPFPGAGTGGGTVVGTEVQGVSTPTGIPVGYQTPEFYQYNLTVERELAKDLALEVGYVGSQGRHLGVRYNLNLPICVTAPCTATAQFVRPYPTFGDIQYQAQVANSGYNALQTSLRRRATGGLTLLASYTFSRAIDTASSTNDSTSGTQKFPQNPRNLRDEKGLSDFHRKHQFSTSFNYELPFGRKRAFLSGARGVTEALLGGWQVNGIVTLLSGRPFTPQYNTNASNSGNQRPNLVGDPFANVPAGLYFNPAAFAAPVASATDLNLFGNLGRNTLIGPGFADVDLSALKNFRLSERVKLQFRAEVFNAFNHPNFHIPEFRLDFPNAGQFTDVEEGREWQFALKLIF